MTVTQTLVEIQMVQGCVLQELIAKCMDKRFASDVTR